MNILFTNNAPIIKYGMACGFKQHGCKIKIVPLWEYKKQNQEKVLKSAVNKFKPDIVFTEGHSGLDQKVLFKVVKEMKLNLFYWAIEDPVHISWISMPYAKQSKFVFTTAEECREIYQKKGIQADTLLFACNPQFHKKTNPDKNFAYDIIFVGSNYDIRNKAAEYILLPFIKENYKIKIWGLWWQDKSHSIIIPDKYYGGLLPYEKLPTAYSSAKVVLGLHCDDSSNTQTSMRTYEALACGAFYMTQYTPAHENLFTYNKHLIWSKNNAETLELAKYYLNNKEERDRIANEGQDFVYKNHTYYQRAAKVLSIADKIL